MLSGPLVLLGAIAINGRAGAPPDDRSTFGPEGHRRLLAYVKPLREARQWTGLNHEVQTATVGRIADMWLSEYDAGRLVPVSPVDFDVPTQDTVLGHIREAQAKVLFGLRTAYLEAEDRKDLTCQAEMLLRTVRFAAITKYTELSAVHQFGFIQTRALKELVEIAPRLDESLKGKVLRGLAAVHKAEKPLERVLTDLRDRHTASLARKGKVATTIEVSSSYGLIADSLERNDFHSMPIGRLAGHSEVFDELATIGTLSKLACTTEAGYGAAMEAAFKALQSPR